MDCSLQLLCPWDFPGKNTGVGCHFLLQGIFPTQGLNLHILHWEVDSLPQGYPEALQKRYIYANCTKLEKTTELSPLTTEGCTVKYFDLGFEGHYQGKKRVGGIIISIRNNNCKGMERPWYIHSSWDMARWMLKSVTRVKQREKNGGR